MMVAWQPTCRIARPPRRKRKWRASMNEESFNISIRKFLKLVGVSSQRDIEQAVAKAVADGAIAGTESFPAKMTLEIAGLKLKVQFDGEIKLE
jgi:hypothetical protein